MLSFAYEIEKKKNKICKKIIKMIIIEGWKLSNGVVKVRDENEPVQCMTFYFGI